MENLDLVPEGFNAAEILDLYRQRIRHLESIIAAATIRGDIDEISKAKAEIQTVNDAINALK